jgi:hypothetical protein
MKIDASSRIFIVSILIIGLIVLCLFYSFEYKKTLKYPSYEAILSSDYPLNQVVYVEGTITEINQDEYYITDNYHDRDIIFKVLGQSPAGLDDEVSILGVLGPSYQILSVEEIRIISDWKYRFLLLRSFLAFTFLLIIFLHYWQLNIKKLTFKRR